MLTLGTTPDGRRRATHAVVAVAVVLALALAGGAIVDSAAATDDWENVTVDRENEEVVVDFSGVDEPAQTVELAVSSPDLEATESRNVTENDEARFDVEGLLGDEAGDGSLTEATLEVTIDGETLEEPVPIGLHVVAFDDALPIWIDGDERLVVPLADESIGVEDGDELAVAASGNGGGTVAGTVGSSESQLRIAVGNLTDALEYTDEIILDIHHEGSSVTPAGGEASIEPELRSIDDALVLWHPMIEAGEPGYDVRFDDGTAIYAERITAVRVGELDPSPTSPEDGLDATVTAAGADDPLVNGSVEAPAPIALEATVDDEGVLAFEPGLEGLAVSHAIIESSETRHVSPDAAIEDGVLDLEEPVGEDDELTLATAAGIVSVDLVDELGVEDGNGDDDDEPPGDPRFEDALGYAALSALVILPAVIGAGVGVGSSRLLTLTGRDRLVINSVGGFLVTLVLAIVLLVVTPDAELSSVGLHHVLALAGVGLGSGLAVVTARSFGDDQLAVTPAGAGGRGVSVDAAPSTFTTSVTVTDGTNRLKGRTKVHYKPADSSAARDKKAKTIVDGRGTIEFPSRGRWEVVAKHGSHKSDVVEVRPSDDEATLAIAFPATVTVTDQTDGEGIPDARVRVIDGGDSETTGRNGVVALDPPSDRSSVDVEIDHEKYRTRTETVRFTRDARHDVPLAAKTGGVRIVSRIDGVPTESMPLRLTPAEQFLQRRSGDVRAVTGRDGVATQDGLMVGRYRVEVPTPGGRNAPFDGGETTVTVREGRTETATIDARFRWSLSPSQRDRIDGLRRDVESLATHSGRDTTIPRYYGSVVESMLETVESMPNAGHQFVGAAADPDDVADAMLTAASNATTAINDAMTTKRNVDLFAACADMPESTVRWRGSCEIPVLLERLESDPTTERNRLKERYQTVSERVERQRQHVSEIAPAQEMHQRAWRLLSDARREEETIATAYAALLLLEAVEELFEHEALRERLSRTVF